MAEVVHHLVSSPKHQVSYTEFDSHTHLINLRNKVFDVNQRRCYPHSLGSKGIARQVIWGSELR